MKKILTVTSVALAGFIASVAPAQAVTLQTSNVCKQNSFSITAAAPTGSGPLVSVNTLSNGLLSEAIATSCVGVFSNFPTVESYQNPSPNLGWLGDGLLNGEREKLKGGALGDPILSPTQFISSSQLQALKDPTQKVDPGWIKLGDMIAPTNNSGSLNTATVSPVGGMSFNLSEVLSYSQMVTGTNGGIVSGEWTLTVNADILSTLARYGFDTRSQFDHLAFVLKAGKEWAVYDFDFTSGLLAQAFDLSLPYTIKGAFRLQDITNDRGNSQGISGLTLWARDPISEPTTRVPEPTSAVLVGLALVGMGAITRRRRASQDQS